MTYRLPDALRTESDTDAVRYLKRYYGTDGGARYTGSYFDAWKGEQDADRFTADDLVAVSFLSVFVPPLAARRLLETDADRFSQLLADVGRDRELVDESVVIDGRWPVGRLYSALRTLPGVGPTIASKLCARKRPRLVPVFDTVVAQVTNSWKFQWEPLRKELRRADGALHERLRSLHDEAKLPVEVSTLRVYDVVTWMEGKEKNLVPHSPDEELGSTIADLS